MDLIMDIVPVTSIPCATGYHERTIKTNVLADIPVAIRPATCRSWLACDGPRSGPGISASWQQLPGLLCRPFATQGFSHRSCARL